VSYATIARFGNAGRANLPCGTCSLATTHAADS